MIHQVALSELTRKRLTDVVVLQMRLLYYAATTTSIDRSGCANYLDRCVRFRGRGTQIAAWLWKARSRYEPLEEFARRATTDEKHTWHKQLACEALTFLRHAVGLIEPHIENTALPWQKAGAAFLRRFYDDLCSSVGLPGYLFSEPRATSFGRQDFLKAFVAANRGLYVCAVCDESGYRTTLDDTTYTDIEHYLPKSRYPHLACHPYNLIPICHLCNSAIKGSADPLERKSGTRRCLEDIFFPYREPGLGSRTYLQVKLGKTPTSAKFGQLKPQTKTDLRQRITAFGDVYKVPKRWRGRVDEIGENLFRRVRQFLQNGQSLPLGLDMLQGLLNALDQLLSYLHEDQGKDPFAFAMTWWLVALINQDLEPATGSRSHSAPQSSVLLQEIKSWSMQDIQASSTRAEVAQNLRRVAKGRV